jgi:hypothetical protein
MIRQVTQRHIVAQQNLRAGEALGIAELGHFQKAPRKRTGGIVLRPIWLDPGRFFKGAPRLLKALPSRRISVRWLRLDKGAWPLPHERRELFEF